MQSGVAGPVTLTLGTDFTGLVPPQPAGKHHKHSAAVRRARRRPAAGRSAAPGSRPGGDTIETRNAAANICIGVPDANPDTGSPP